MEAVERFTQSARAVIAAADREAAGFRHDYVGTEHRLLGLLAAPPEPDLVPLHACGAGLENARREIIRLVGPGASSEGGRQFSARARDVLLGALREAHRAGSAEVSVVHLLLGLLREGEGVGVRVLMDLNVDPDQLLRATLEAARG